MKLLVVGANAAGLSAASRARRLDATLSITVVDKGSRISFGACGMPYFIEGQVRSLDQITVHSPAFFERERNIQVRTGAEVVAVRHAAREAVLLNGERLPYDRLVWAAGARPRHTSADPRVFNFHSPEDGQRLHDYLESQKPRSAVIIGGGAVGCELATALRARSLDVTLYHNATTLLGREDDWLSRRVAARLTEARVTLHLNTPAPAQHGADITLLATGLEPNPGPLADAGAEVGRTGALRTDDRMETSLRGVFAAGDCAEVTHLVTGRPTWLPLGSTANKAGRIAGANAAGARERFEGITGTAIVRIAGLAVATTGLSPQQARREGFSPVDVVIDGRAKPRFFLGRSLAIQLVADRNSGRLLGGAVLGDDNALARINVLSTALSAKMRASDLASLDLAYSPPYSTAVDPLLTAAQQLVKVLQ